LELIQVNLIHRIAEQAMLQTLKPRRDAPQSSTALADYAHVREAIEFLTDHWREQPDLERLAGHLGLSPFHCQRLFKRWCGLSPKEFVQAITIDHARALLTDSASLLDTAYEVGLSGPARLHDLFVDHEAMTPGDYKRRGAGLEIAYGFHPSPFGLALVMATERGVCGLAFCDGEEGRMETLADMARRWPAAKLTEQPERTDSLAEAIFAKAGNRDTRLDVVLIGTDFEVRVWDTLLKIPAGRACTYSDIARYIGDPKASRAVGAAVGRNPISFVVPCHRVLGKSGDVTGYHWGVTRKHAIIGWEKGKLAAGASIAA
jgi:AraC family transcriptional regulator, regulatory protein of adaptative response / methylated-DNA-[protein]-cysteine methyltransferase